MSASYIFQCPICGFEIEAWDDGHPFIVDDAGKRHFFYHPGERDVINAVVAASQWAKAKLPAEIESELPMHTGYMNDALCGDCGAVSKIDAEATVTRCLVCGSGRIDEVLKLGGKRCPKCKTGLFPQEPIFGAIS